MQGEQQKRWQEFCELAAKERDPRRLIQLLSEINRLFEAEHTEKRKKPAQKTNPPPTSIRTGTGNDSKY
jgi:hypothetical protein